MTVQVYMKGFVADKDAAHGPVWLASWSTLLPPWNERDDGYLRRKTRERNGLELGWMPDSHAVVCPDMRWRR